MLAASDKRTIVEVQYLRAIAVLLVIVAHIHQTNQRFFSAPLLGDAAFAGFSGVDVFFVISGFIIHHIYGGHSGLDGRYFLNRLNRILPLYWIFSALAVAGYLVMGDSLTHSLGELDLVSSALLLPSHQPPVLVVGWTLTHELYFYLAYGLSLLLPRPWRIRAAAAWGLASLAYALLPGMPTWPWLAVMLSPFNLLFLSGILLASQYHRLQRGRWLALALAIAGAAGAGAWTNSVGLEGLVDPAHRVAIFLPFAIGLTWCVLAWRPAMPTLFARIGDASYSLYLSHILVIGVLGRVLPARLDSTAWSGPVFYLTCLTACLIVGFASHYGLERPLVDFGKQLIRQIFPSPPRSAAS